VGARERDGRAAEGVLEFRRGRGITVSGTPERGAVVVRARELVEFARRQATARTNSPDSSKTWPDTLG
jgi:hypothetical protein